MSHRSYSRLAATYPRRTPSSPLNREQNGQEFADLEGIRDESSFSIRRDGRWWVFEGRVESPSTKTRLFAQVPEVDGALWIVDRLRTGRGRES